jgi:hypothetical protein
MTDNINRLNTDDQEISNLVRSVRFKIPDHLDEKVTQTITETVKSKPRLFPEPFPWLRLSLSAAAIMILVTAIFIFQPYLQNTREPIPPISEIRTHFEISDKNIKILWVQKKDFKLIRRTEQ